MKIESIKVTDRTKSDCDKPDVTSSVLYGYFVKSGKLPSIDVLLDWRNRLNEMKENKDYPLSWYEREILATDYLLSKHFL